MNLNSMIFVNINLVLLVCFISNNQIEACGPGRQGFRRLRMRRLIPLVQRQYIPNVKETNLAASGKDEGAISRYDIRFRELVKNVNPDIEFRDDEGTGADRMMTQRLKEKLSTLAISVMNQWPNIKLRVIEGWDEDMKHSMNSLHYEGRAVDITTSDRDNTKHGMLARLAVEAGFDWVHYETRSYVHCSVKSEKADNMRNNGCFDSKSLVETPEGTVEMSQLQTNDQVMTMNSEGKLQFSPIIMWLDRDESGQELFVELKTKSNRVIRLTSSHLIYVSDEPFDLTESSSSSSQVKYVYDEQKQQTSLAIQSDFKSGKAHTKHHYYHYDVKSPTNSTNVLKKESNHNVESNLKTTKNVPNPAITNPLANAKNNQITDEQLFSKTTSRSIDELAYTTYSRNVIVGQYLLINSDYFAQNDSHTFPDNSYYELDQPEIPPRTYSGHNTDSSNLAPTQKMFINSQDSTNGRTSSRLVFFHHSKDDIQEKSKFVPTSSEKVIMFDEIVSIDFNVRKGIYAPLTREGNIVVNSVVASCYAVISDQELAHMSFAPVRWISYLKEWLIGLHTDRPLQERTVEAIKRSGKDNEKLSDEQETKHDTQTALAFNLDSTQSYIGGIKQQLPQTTPTTTTNRQVHWYPMMLYRIAKFILPAGYLY